MATPLEGGEQGQRPGLDKKSFAMIGADGKVSPYSMIEEDGKPTFAAKRRFQCSFALVGRGLNLTTGKLQAKILPIVQSAFNEGDLDILMDMAELTSPANYGKTELGLGNCQVINDLVVLALSILIGEDNVSHLQYNYQAGFGQESGEVAMDRAVSSSGGNGFEPQAEAGGILSAKNSDRDETPLDAWFVGVHERLMAIINEVRAEVEKARAEMKEELLEVVKEVLLEAEKETLLEAVRKSLGVFAEAREELEVLETSEGVEEKALLEAAKAAMEVLAKVRKTVEALETKEMVREAAKEVEEALRKFEKAGEVLDARKEAEEEAEIEELRAKASELLKKHREQEAGYNL